MGSSGLELEVPLGIRFVLYSKLEFAWSGF